MRIYLEQLAVEALGIPEGMMEATDYVWDKMMKIWADDMDPAKRRYGIEQLFGGGVKEVVIPGPIKIGDEEWDKVTVEWNVKTLRSGSPKIDPMYGGAGFGFQSNLASNFKRIEGAPSNIIPLQMIIVANETNTWEDIYDAVNGPLEKEVYKTLAHELKHAFDHRKDTESTSPKKGIKAQSRGRYSLSSNQLGIKSIDSFNYKVYYTHFIENLVRPVELLAKFRKDNVTKKDFYNALKQSDAYKMIKDIEDFSYEKLVESIKQDPVAISAITRRLIGQGKDPDAFTEDDLVQEVLQLNFENSIEAMKDMYIDMAVEGGFERSAFFMGLDGLDVSNYINQDKQEAMEDVVNDIGRFGNNYEAFYKYEIKKMKILANKTFRKLAKIYDYLPA